MSRLALSRTSRTRNIEDLPSEILIEFLIRLPVRDLARARLTCKVWHWIISDYKFVDMHLKYSAKRRGYLYTIGEEKLYFGETEGVSPLEKCKPLGELLKMKSIEDLRTPLITSGGLMAYTKKDDSFCYVCNPVTGERINIAMGPFFGESFHTNWCGLVYSPLIIEYKILLISSPLTKYGAHERVSRAAIYTLGSGSSWREISGDIPYTVSSTSRPVDFEGNMFWFVSRNCDRYGRKCIGSFNGGTESFKLWKGPNIDMPRYCNEIELLVSGGTIAFLKFERSLRCSIWMLRDMVNEQWVNEIIIPVATHQLYRCFHFFGNWKSNHTFFGIGGSYDFRLVTYDANNRREQEFFPPLFEWGKRRHFSEKPRFVPHMGSLVSPKTIMALPLL